MFVVEREHFVFISSLAYLVYIEPNQPYWYYELTPSV